MNFNKEQKDIFLEKRRIKVLADIGELNRKLENNVFGRPYFIDRGMIKKQIIEKRIKLLEIIKEQNEASNRTSV